MFYSDGEHDVSIMFNGALTTAFVSDREFGLMAKGHAKHNPEDTYDQTKGMDLAVARATSRLYAKVAKRLAR
jgi:hypothetical protein